ncbi:MAG: MlaE family lipid ABC transporter permease subunit [Chthoniobacterales bacterium]
MADPDQTQKSNSSELCEIKEEGDAFHVELHGDLSAKTVGDAWEKAFSALEKSDKKKVLVDAKGVDYCDGSGVAFLFALRMACVKNDKEYAVEGLKEQFQTLFDQFPKDGKLDEDTSKRHSLNFVERIGEGTYMVLKDWRAQIVFIGEMLYATRFVIRHPRKFRWNDTLVIAEKAGINALPIVAMIGFLMGLIMAFQAVAPLKQFGVEIFVVNLVSLAMLRELGPIMTAIMLAGRSGSAFAAEIGTMKVNEEINALVTMGIEPVPFLALPRMLAATCMMPVLTMYANLVGIAGGMLVMLSLGHPWAELYTQLTRSVGLHDVFAGLIKTFVFGTIVASIGVLRGLQTASGATAVGESATRAVVSGIFLIVFTDALFSIVFYVLDI